MSDKKNNINTDLLSGITVASPCAVDWDSMSGDERVRFCGQCTKHVYNLSEMSKKDAEDLIAKSEGKKTCIRYYLRKDGSIMTEDCPVGLRVVRNGLRKLSAAAAAFVSIIVSIVPTMAGTEKEDKTASDKASPKASEEPRRMMGEMVALPTESPNQPWMTSYKKNMVTKIMEKLPKDWKSDSPQVLVQMESNGKILNVFTTKCSTDQKVAANLNETIRAITFAAFPKETELKEATFRLTISK